VACKLISAIRAQDPVLTKRLIDGRADPNAKDKDGYLALPLAAAKRNEAICRILLEAKADPNATDKDGRSSLHYSAVWGPTTVCKLLLDAKADPNAEADGKTALLWAVHKSTKEQFKLLLEAKASPHARDKDGKTALHLATSDDIEAICKPALEAKADPDAQDNSGDTALHVAASKGNEPICKLLLHEKANLHTKNKGEKTSLHHAACGSRSDFLQHYEALESHEAVFRLLLDAQADLHTRDKTGETILHSAARGGSEAICNLVLQSKADPNSRTNDGETPLQMAAEEEKERVFRLLLEARADLHVKDKSGKTLLHSVAKGGNEAICRLLLEANIDPNIKAKEGETALHKAAALGQTALCKLLLDGKADPNAVDEKGETALHKGSQEKDLCEILLAAKADPNAKDKYGLRPLHASCMPGKAEALSRRTICKLLIGAKADPKVQDKYGISPLHWTASLGEEEIYKLLIDTKADPTLADEDGWTPLHWTARGSLDDYHRVEGGKYGFIADPTWKVNKGNETVCHLLLAAKADPTVTGKDGQTADEVTSSDAIKQSIEINQLMIMAKTASKKLQSHLVQEEKKDDFAPLIEQTVKKQFSEVRQKIMADLAKEREQQQARFSAQYDEQEQRLSKEIERIRSQITGTQDANLQRLGVLEKELVSLWSVKQKVEKLQKEHEEFLQLNSKQQDELNQRMEELGSHFTLSLKELSEKLHHEQNDAIAKIQQQLAAKEGNDEQLQRQLVTLQKESEIQITANLRHEMEGKFEAFSKETGEQQQRLQKQLMAETKRVEDSFASGMQQLTAQIEKIAGRLTVLRVDDDRYDALQQQLHEVKANQNILMREYDSKRALLAKQAYLYRVPQLLRFYRCTQLKLAEVFLAIKNLASGMIDVQPSASARHAQQGLDLVDKFIGLAGLLFPLPGISLISSLASSGLQIASKVIEEQSKKAVRQKIEKQSASMPSASDIDVIAESTARQLAYRYQDQLMRLAPENGRILAECALARIFCYLDTEFGNLPMAIEPTDSQKWISSQLVTAVYSVKLTKEYSKLAHKIIVTEDGKEWSEDGVLTKTGIKVPDDTSPTRWSYFSGKETQPEKYGYRLGEELEARSLKLLREERSSS
jgi:ankyrin repeat protein